VCLFTVTGRQQDAIISSIHNMASFAPFPFYPRPLVGRYEADENDHHDYPMLLRIRSESSEMMKRKVQSSIFLPTRPHPVLERCQCSDCYHRHYDDDIYPIPMQTFSLKRESMDEVRSPPPLSPVRNDESDDDEELEVVDKEIRLTIQRPITHRKDSQKLTQLDHHHTKKVHARRKTNRESRSTFATSATGISLGSVTSRSTF